MSPQRDEIRYTIKQASQLSGLPASTLRYYESIGIIGAFAITNDVLLIIAGLGAGAIWVRSLTVYLMRAGVLSKYRYLEHGAHWAILALGLVMLIKLYHIEPPEWMVGSLGLVFIATAVVSSVLEMKRAESTKKIKAKKPATEK